MQIIKLLYESQKVVIKLFNYDFSIAIEVKYKTIHGIPSMLQWAFCVAKVSNDSNLKILSL